MRIAGIPLHVSLEWALYCCVWGRAVWIFSTTNSKRLIGLMNEELLGAARSVKAAINNRIQLQIPSILARGAEFSPRIGITRLDGMPLTGFPRPIHFENSLGIRGLPSSFQMDSNQSTATISGLRPAGDDVCLVRGIIDSPHLVERSRSTICSNPAWVFNQPPYRLYWGDLHVHTSFSSCHIWRCLDPRIPVRWST